MDDIFTSIETTQLKDRPWLTVLWLLLKTPLTTTTPPLDDSSIKLYFGHFE